MNPETLLSLAVPVVFGVLLAIESKQAARKFDAVPGWRRTGVLFFLMVMAIGGAVPHVLSLDRLVSYRLFDLSTWGLWGILPGLLTSTFILYWFHRAEHKYDWLWRAGHQLHHSAQRVDLLGAYYAHPFEVTTKVLVGSAVSLFLLGLSPVAASALAVLSASLSMLQHWNINTPRWLGFIVPRPESHCLHHERDLHARNYSDLPIWDLLFGTFDNPRQPFRSCVGFRPEAALGLGDMLLMRGIRAGSKPEIIPCCAARA